MAKPMGSSFAVDGRGRPGGVLQDTTDLSRKV